MSAIITGGSPVSVFNDLVDSVGPTLWESPEKFIVESVQRNYILSRFMEDDVKKMIQGGGLEIQDHILRDLNPTFGFYNPNAMHTWQNPQRMQSQTTRFRYAVDHYSWTQQEVIHSMRDSRSMTDAARTQKYFDLWTSKQAGQSVSTQTGMEQSLVAVPNAAQMEAADGTSPMSLIALCNEETDGLYTGFTTLQGLSPGGADEFFQHPQVTYNAEDPRDENDEQQGLWDAFARMWYLLQFRPPPRDTQFFEKEARRLFIATSLGGALQYDWVARKYGGFLRSSSTADPSWSRLTYRGVDIEEFASLEDIAVYDDGASGRTTYDNASSPGPRYMWFNTNYIKMIFHAERFFHTHPTREHPNQLGSYVKPIEVWFNLFCRSRRRGCGIVYPQAPVAA
jgi:hypothetical protein